MNIHIWALYWSQIGRISLLRTCGPMQWERRCSGRGARLALTRSEAGGMEWG